jgi:nucleoside 2-deoxyribosyltransferase
MPRCPICLIDDPRVLKDPTTGDHRFYECPRCGRFDISGTAETIVPNEDRETRGRLSIVTRLTSDNGSFVRVGMDELPRILSAAPSWKGLVSGVDRLLTVLSDKATSYSDQILFDPDIDYPLAYTHSPEACQDLVDMAADMGFLRENLMTLTVQGWLRVDELRESRTSSRQAFVAMWFDDSLLDAWTLGFKPGIESHGHFSAVRIDRVEHNDKIDDRIVAEIRRSGLLVADFTGHRGGVYFEAGYAMGLGIPVIWTCREDHMGQAHFDTRQYNHIVWTTPASLAAKLADRIAATIRLA